MKIRPILFGTLLVVCSFSAHAQFGYYHDALQYSRTRSMGTARTQAIGSAQAALGGDINSAYANPAGLGFNRSSVVTFTPSLNFYNSDSEYFEQTTGDSKTNFNIANLGVIFSFAKGDIEKSKFKGGSFAITMTRENNFNYNAEYEAYNESEFGSSVVDKYLDDVNFPDPNGPLDPVPLDALTDFEYYGLFSTYLINPNFEKDVNGQDSLTHYYKFIGDFPFQNEKLQQNGNQTQWDFAYGANYDDKIYFGASLSINSINYKTTATLTESDFIYDEAPDDAINYLSTRDELDVKGTGVSGTFGLIARPFDFFRLGITAVTPTYYSIREESSKDMIVSYNDFVFIPGEDPLTYFEDQVFFETTYNFRTPFKLTTGAAFFLGKIGFISADIDFIDYSKAKFKTDDENITVSNQDIRNLYQNTINFRTGVEIRLRSFRIRGGYNYQGDPYVDSPINNSIKQLSGGLGYRNREFFVDLSVVHSKWKTLRTPYTITDIAYPTAYIENKNLNVSVTFGVNF
ncbi:hypothetical protein SAMN04488029_1878 [Reichenbachiella faecimaris]|uniref:Outer membrane protein transport protein (OMPP1/FadL/TodX) n=1 Tax=Reichenbachiella faecimaris TaxID=692418 RepID=A0A1W2GD06_REIFA|nr:hypothetical protein [Reichenbachiella faecimaris]SMD34166.1 hypothetical protein SAMN04488029_1878 [Reichenbachiella faecimaris]